MGEVLLRPGTLEELSEAVTSVPRLRVTGSGSRLGWCRPWSGPEVSTSGLTGIVSMRKADGVATVRAGTMVCDLLEELAPAGLTLPLATDLPVQVSQRAGTVGGLVSLGLPHAIETECGPIRDWVLGVTVVRGDGSIAKAGSSVLKSVAGYDVHRFAVGSRGSYFAVAEVVLRLVRLASVPPSNVSWHREGEPAYVGRVPRTGVEEVAGVLGSEPGGHFWSDHEPRLSPPGWWIGPNGTRSYVQSRALELMASETLDPIGRFAPGWAE